MVFLIEIAATKEINEVRGRAYTSLVLQAGVDIDYNLDEYMQEFYFEEWRIFTLIRQTS